MISTNSLTFVIFFLFLNFTIFLAILPASFSSPNILMTNFNSSSLKLLTTSWAEILFKPIDISSFSLDLKEKPLLKSFN